MENEQNPLGLINIDHLEFTTDTLGGSMEQTFYSLGLSKTHEDTGNKSCLFRQAQINFVMTADPSPHSPSRLYFQKHGEGVSKISFLVENVEVALEKALNRGARLVQDFRQEQTAEGTFRTGAIAGFGDVINEFVERPKEGFRPSFKKLADDPLKKPLRSPLLRIDHLTNNVPKGEMDHWVEFYQRIYGFKVTRYFDIKGTKTGLYSKVVQLENGAIIIPINEPDAANGKSQIQEFLDRHHGPGVQHIALTTSDMISTISQLLERKIRFLDIPHTYYEDIPKRNLHVQEDLSALEKNKILVDGDEEGYLLQIFSDTYIGPSFFEIIQRKKHWGFGEGNFQALFDAIERDQIQRGYLSKS